VASVKLSITRGIGRMVNCNTSNRQAKVGRTRVSGHNAPHSLNAERNQCRSAALRTDVDRLVLVALPAHCENIADYGA
jgi:hypothetical protein